MPEFELGDEMYVVSWKVIIGGTFVLSGLVPITSVEMTSALLGSPSVSCCPPERTPLGLASKRESAPQEPAETGANTAKHN